MAKSSLYAAHRAAGAASGKYKASLYDIANIGYAMEADISIEKYKESRRQEGWQTLQQALAVADTAYGSYQSSQRHEEMKKTYGLEKPKLEEKQKTPDVKSKKEVIDAMGSKQNPFVLAGKGAKAVGDLFRQAKEAGIEEGTKIWGKIGEEVKQWEYIYK